MGVMTTTECVSGATETRESVEPLPSRTNKRERGAVRWFVVIHRTTTLLLGLVVTATLALVVLIHLSPSGAVRVFGVEARPVRSGSMEPALEVGDVALIKPAAATPSDSIRVGSIITFRAPGRGSMIISHRVTAVQADATGQRSFITRGDANSAPDGTAVPDDNVIGVVTGRIPRLGYVMYSLTQGRALLVVCCSAVLSSCALWLARRSQALAAAQTVNQEAIQQQQETTP